MTAQKEPPQAFGIVGLGRIGGGLVQQARAKQLRVVGYNRSDDKTHRLAEETGMGAAFSLDELAEALPRPRVVLMFVPHGAVDDVLDQLVEVLDEGDVIVDGGNSNWRDSVRRQKEMARRRVGFVDAGTSGGAQGAREGACFMVGGEDDDVRRAVPVLRALAVDDAAVLHAGPPGAGHFVKLIHNAVEFGMVQALAEGVEMLSRADYDLDLAAVMSNWSHGSVVRGWLVELMERQLREGPPLDQVGAQVEDTKEGKWYVQFALEKEVPAFVMTLSELMFYRYRDPESIAGRAVALLRNGYGEHPLPQPTRAPESTGEAPTGRGGR